jgi:hypothetical protein
MWSLFSAFKAALSFIFTVLHHKWQIILAGMWLNKLLASTGLRVSWRRLLLHDLSKFSPAEFWPYARHYHSSETTSADYAAAWRHHYENNDHHHEYYKGARMTEEALVELVADWFAAAISYSGKWPRDGDWPWLTRRYKHVTDTMHVTDATLLSALLTLLGFEKCIMTALHGEGHVIGEQEARDEKNLQFDWQQARHQLRDDPALQRKFDAVHTLYSAQHRE